MRSPIEWSVQSTIQSSDENPDAATITTAGGRPPLSERGSDGEVTSEGQAKSPQGVPDNVVRTVTENCRTLKFDSNGFEKE